MDLSFLEDFFTKRPEVSKEKLTVDLEKYYLPFLNELLAIKKTKNSSEGIIVGVSAIQGAGKTTQGEIMHILLNQKGLSAVSLSIDDHYLTHRELCELREEDPRFIRRGVTHDLNLAKNNLESLVQMKEGEVILISGYDKGANSGDGERFRWINPTEELEIKIVIKEKSLMVDKKNKNCLGVEILSAKYQGHDLWLPANMGADIPLISPLLPEALVNFLEKETENLVTVSGDEVVFSGASQFKIPKKDLPNAWKVVNKKPDFIFYDGWMLGARMVSDEAVFESGLPALDSPEHIEFAKYINQKLLNYEPLWEMVDFMNVLYVVNYEDSLKWRDQAEEVLRAKGEGMSPDEIKEFIYYFWRSVHPAIQIKNLAIDQKNTQQVVIINDDHSIGEVLTPLEVKQQYS
jgi:pantothenate kinase-related protein Tda10